jgi:hypothetical protein
MKKWKSIFSFFKTSPFLILTNWGTLASLLKLNY